MAKIVSKRAERLRANNKKINQQTRNKFNKRINPFSAIDDRDELFYSGFCLTDNKTFAFFYADDKKMVDNLQTKDLNRFKLTELDLDMVIDKEHQLEPIMKSGSDQVEFPEGFVDIELFNIMKNLYPDCVFHHINEFFGKTVNSMVIVLHEEYGKPVGLFKTTN